jgi:hypothetical protein
MIAAIAQIVFRKRQSQKSCCISRARGSAVRALGTPRRKDPKVRFQSTRDVGVKAALGVSVAKDPKRSSGLRQKCRLLLDKEIARFRRTAHRSVLRRVRQPAPAFPPKVPRAPRFGAGAEHYFRLIR